MKWLLDTDICIYIIKQKPISVLKRFNTVQPGSISLSIITLAELVYGARKSSAIQKNLNALHQFIIPFEIVPFGYNAALEYGIIRAELEKLGNPIGPLDTLIAAHARSLNHTLVTNNEKEFKRIIGLKVENWTKIE